MAQQIKHVIVLMLENRSFDHMLGFLKSDTYPIDGLNRDESNPSDDFPDPVPVEAIAADEMEGDPKHEHSDTNEQLYLKKDGPPLEPEQKPNKGFVKNYRRHASADESREVMHCFDADGLPVLSGLAKAYAVCDHWYSSVPGPTWPNRFFVHAASSKGAVSNDPWVNYDMRSIQESLSDAGLTWKIYSHDFPLTQLLWRLTAVEYTDNWDSFGGFKRDAREGHLRHYSFIEPKYLRLFGEANDQHPPHSVKAGEELIDEVYHAVRTSQQWNDSMLVILHDEHGGLFDHLLPPAAPPPDHHVAKFKFDRLGVRVPAVFVSPFIPAGTIVPGDFDHASVPASIKKIFGLPAFLTERDRHARTFDGVASLDRPRKGTPERFGPAPAAPTDDWGDELAPQADARHAPRTGDAIPATEFHESFLDAARQLPVEPELQRIAMLDEARPMLTEHDVAVYVRQAQERFRIRQRKLHAMGVRGVPGRNI